MDPDYTPECSRYKWILTTPLSINGSASKNYRPENGKMIGYYIILPCIIILTNERDREVSDRGIFTENERDTDKN